MGSDYAPQNFDNSCFKKSHITVWVMNKNYQNYYKGFKTCKPLSNMVSSHHENWKEVIN